MPARRPAVAHALRALLTLTVIGVVSGLAILSGSVATARPARASTEPTAAPTSPAPSPTPSTATTAGTATPTATSTQSSATVAVARLQMRARRTVTRGTKVHIFALLTAHTHPRSDTMIRFYRRRDAQSHWAYVGHTRTQRNGYAKLPWYVHHSAQWMARVGAHRSVASAPQHDHARSLGRSAVRIAATRRGDPYSYGASGPSRFDCSGLTRYVFGRLGVWLPHNAAAQYAHVHHIGRHHKEIGDLIFFHSSSGHVYHVAIFAGNGMMWHAPHTGDHVRRQHIYSGSYYVGRVRR